MGRTIYAYDDRYWVADQTFTYTGEAREFTLEPGEYLFICNGGAGGGTDPATCWGYGGTTYGIFETDQTETMYAVVGGNGDDYIAGDDTLKRGGFNGGGNGGVTTTGNDAGGGGGGASDIRLTMDTTPVPPVYHSGIPAEYEEQECLWTKYEETGFVNTGYKLNPNSHVEIVMYIHGASIESSRTNSWQIPFGARRSSGNADEFYFSYKCSDAHKVCIKTSGHNVYFPDNGPILTTDRKMTITIDAPTQIVSWTDGEITQSLTMQDPMPTSNYPMYLFADNNGSSAGTGSGQDYCWGLQIYSCKIYENDVLLHDLVPVKVAGAGEWDEGAYGMYDIIDQAYHPGVGSASGHRIHGKAFDIPTRTLLSRIIVAGGGGGMAKQYAYGNIKPSYGGGLVAGYTQTSAGAFYSHTDRRPARQDEGYAFGRGEDGYTRTMTPSYGAEGAGGGGGGWYGGYSEAQFNFEKSSINGAGGSSYVLTADSYKPHGYIPTSHYYLKKTAVVPCQTTVGSILICKQTNINVDDTIIVPLTGNATALPLYPGVYDMKCWGGEGGMFNSTGTRYEGGYSEARLTIDDKKTVYGVVGGSGLFQDNHSSENRPFGYWNNQCAYNGGGLAEINRTPSAGMFTMMPFAGGGATDIRLTMDDSPAAPIMPDPDRRQDIPSGYTQLKALSSSSAYFDPGYIIQNTTELHVDCSIIASSYPDYPVLFGVQNDGSAGFAFFPHVIGRAAHWQLNDQYSGIAEANGTKSLPLSTRLTIDTGLTTLTWASDTDGESMTISNSNTIHATNRSISFGADHSGNGYDAVLPTEWYNIRISESGTTVHDFVPVIRDSDDTAGFLDITTNTFYTWNNTRVPLQDSDAGPTKSMMSRILVAGGAGGQGYSSGMPGKGGGTTGGSISGGNGTNAGPGTQTSSPQSASYPDISGGFGYGGKGFLTSGGRGGGGGGGWFGGSGTYPNGSSDNDKGGAGGSGYILTADSYKPEHYIPGEEWYLTNGVTTLGGNTLNPNVTKIEIHVVQALLSKLIIHDSSGYKTFDEDENRWTVFTSGEITPEDIEEYGVYKITSLVGVLDKFNIIANDPDDDIGTASVKYFPNKQTLTVLVPNHLRLNREAIDAIYDDTIYDLTTHTSKYDNEYNAYHITVDKLSDVESDFKLYSIQLFSN